VQANDEPNIHRPRRYTQSLRLSFENLLPAPQDVEVKLTLDGGTSWISEKLSHGVSKQVAEIRDAKPGIAVYEYRILAP